MNFRRTLSDHGIDFRRRPTKTLQINLGKLCNQACHHCHVEAGPNRTELMTRETIDHCLSVIDKSEIESVDLTGGAPELNPEFDYIVEELTKRGVHTMVRCNLTVIYEPGKDYLPSFYAKNKAEVIASLPCYSKENVKKQRGSGVFEKSIRALRELNALGYGKEGTGLLLNLVYNPVGPSLPPDQAGLQKQYKLRLKEDFGIEFNHLFTVTNMPVKRFAEYLRRNNQWESYMELLVNNFNAEAAKGVMCFDLLSVGWDGKLYDCDFNQMLEIPAKLAPTIEDLDLSQDTEASIAVADHCFGCTAGAGSSCQGALNA